MSTRTVFVTGATGYMGSRLIPRLIRAGHRVLALVRPTSAHAAPSGTTVVTGNALDSSTFADKITPADTIVHLIGVAHPSPAKKSEFVTIDLKSVQEIVAAAVAASVQHLVYVSVAQNAPVMRAYQAVRKQCEDIIKGSGVPATILRPFYVVGPGHYWIQLLKPVYWLLMLNPKTRVIARSVATVSIAQMLCAIEYAVDHPPMGIHIMDVAEIRNCKSTTM